MRIERIVRNGKDFAVVPLNDLQRLISDAEMLADITAYDRAKARLERGEDELIPFEITRRPCHAQETGLRIEREPGESGVAAAPTPARLASSKSTSSDTSW